MLIHNNGNASKEEICIFNKEAIYMGMEKQPFSQCRQIKHGTYPEYLEKCLTSFAEESSQGQSMGPGTKRYCFLNCVECAFRMLATSGGHISVMATVEGAVANTEKVSKAAPSPTSACSCDGTRAKGICGSSPTGAMAIAWQGGSQQVGE